MFHKDLICEYRIDMTLGSSRVTDEEKTPPRCAPIRNRAKISLDFQKINEPKS
ncbi:hypothetical protein PAXRUDRAFT_833839 [Paxillus rubicundulus Ve08.2h10]|uniref:Uncharacterized protein n=1 Tax=Paxillus rubicundulus Ve08.2h10 TaxID=930991 RepID=A0A0D0DFT2_9AGAM|nr:hypothetical protein PAXRUDRAFT_833839 [Paxillus rubicundulus Ve08.2h10]